MTESSCSRCDTLKPVEEFVTRKSTGRPVSWCKVCKREWDRESYRIGRGQGSDRKLRMRQSTKNGQNRSRIIIWGHLSKNPCVDCGESDIVVLDFDHLPEFEKTMEVSKMLGYSPDRILAEIAKCQVVCANCHRRRTASRRGWTKMLDNIPIPVSFSGRTTASGAVDEVSITSAGTNAYIAQGIERFATDEEVRAFDSLCEHKGEAGQLAILSVGLKPRRTNNGT